MATIETKFSIGDTVFHAWTTTERKQHPCPDCLGSRKWEAQSPAGREYQFDCPRCAAGYRNDNDITLDYSIFSPAVQRLTIGQARAYTGHDEPTQYMCVETGVGSGTIYYEKDLFWTEEEAFAAADIRAKMQNAETKWVVDQYNKSLRVCDYQLSDALVKAEKDRLQKIRITLNYVIEDIRESYDMDEVKKHIAKFDETAEIS